MKHENLSKLIEEFIRRLHAYGTKYGKDDFWKYCLKVYTNELKDWHDLNHFPDETKITKERYTVIADTLLDAISYMSKKNIKERMKKSELKALIREIVREAYFGAAGMAASKRDAEQRKKHADDARKKAGQSPVKHPTAAELDAAKKKLAQLPDEDWSNYRKTEVGQENAPDAQAQEAIKAVEQQIARLMERAAAAKKLNVSPSVGSSLSLEKLAHVCEQYIKLYNNLK